MIQHVEAVDPFLAQLESVNRGLPGQRAEGNSYNRDLQTLVTARWLTRKIMRKPEVHSQLILEGDEDASKSRPDLWAWCYDAGGIQAGQLFTLRDKKDLNRTNECFLRARNSLAIFHIEFTLEHHIDQHPWIYNST